MKKIGKEVAFLKIKEGNPRNGEGTFIRLKDGSILHVYTEYFGDSWADHATAKLSAVVSHDEGETWSAPYVLLDKDDGAQNYMSPSLLRLPNGDIGMVFLRKEEKDTGLSLGNTKYVCMPVFAYSKDEGKTWSDYSYCVEVDGYYCAINDGAIIQRSGRIAVPMSSHADGRGGEVIIVCSDDCGKTWYTLPTVFRSPFENCVNGLEEPGLYEHEDGELWMYCRTIFGHQYESRSNDNGVTWSPVVPNLYFTSPNSPMRVKKVGKYTVAVFNPLPANCLRDDYTGSGNIRRTPFVIAVSDDDGLSFKTYTDFIDGKHMIKFSSRAFLLEDSLGDTYCYPSVIETKDGFVVAYYHSDGGTYTLASTKISKVYLSEIES